MHTDSSTTDQHEIWSGSFVLHRLVIHMQTEEQTGLKSISLLTATPFERSNRSVAIEVAYRVRCVFLFCFVLCASKCHKATIHRNRTVAQSRGPP